MLDSRQGVLKGGESGAVVVPGEPEKSTLVKAVLYTDSKLQMPPDERLSQREVETLAAWVKMGVPDPREGPATNTATDKAKAWWSFQPIRDSSPPAVRDQAWPRSGIDRFILAQLESRGMKPAPADDKRTLIRRATFDLTGLPPTPAEVAAFLADDSSDAFARVVDRLLASPAYGERWGRHWLDVVRYADTSGCNSDFPIPDAWRYRNYVIDSFNADKPFDRFLREQIAGDLLPAKSDQQRFEHSVL